MSEIPLPVQIQTAINDMLAQKDSVYIRLNKRQYLKSVSVAIENAIKRFDIEYETKAKSAKKR